jgi:hypothetical protein
LSGHANVVGVERLERRHVSLFGEHFLERHVSRRIITRAHFDILSAFGVCADDDRRLENVCNLLATRQWRRGRHNDVIVGTVTRSPRARNDEPNGNACEHTHNSNGDWDLFKAKDHLKNEKLL